MEVEALIKAVEVFHCRFRSVYILCDNITAINMSNKRHSESKALRRSAKALTRLKGRKEVEVVAAYVSSFLNDKADKAFRIHRCHDNRIFLVAMLVGAIEKLSVLLFFVLV